MARRGNADEFGTPDGKPWDEEQWEAFMRECDLRSARYGEILETVMDDPDRDLIIAEEMGWDVEECEGATDGGREPFDHEEAERVWDDEGAVDDTEDDLDTPAGDPMVRSDRHSIPAYRLAFDVGMKVHCALKRYMAERAEEDDYDERLGAASIGCHIAAAKISGGHAMGYEDEVLCGNIANCKRGLAGAIGAEQALLELKADGTLPADVVDALLPDVRAVIEAVTARIAELRERVWW